MAFLCAATAAAGQFGRWSDRADAINIVLPGLLAAGGIAVAAALLLDRAAPRRRHDLAWSGLLLLVPLPLLLSDLPRPPHRRDCDGPSLRLIQFNVWKDNRFTPGAARWIERSGADVVVLQEASARPMIAPQLPGYPFRQSCVGEASCSTVILGRRRWLASGGLAEGDPENRGGLSAAWARLDVGGTPVTIVAAHLGRPWPWRRYPPDRERLASFVRSQGSVTTIVAGDLNLPGWTFQMKRLEAALTLERATRMLPSWPAALPLLGLDHVLLGARWQALGIRRGPFLGSDHRPLAAQLRLCTGARDPAAAGGDQM